MLERKIEGINRRMRIVIERQEQNLIKMERVYGKRTASKLRGAIISKRKNDFLLWERDTLSSRSIRRPKFKNLKRACW